MNNIETAMQHAHDAFVTYRQTSAAQKAALLKAIANGLEKNATELMTVTGRETHLPEARLRNELTRTINQLNMFAAACENNRLWTIRKDLADANRTPPKPDIRKTMVPLGPVVVFGASNFPYAFSTAGGDTAAALAAGCTVVVKAHPAHPETSKKVATIIAEALHQLQLPEGVFQHVVGSGNEVGEQLVKHPFTTAVAFTGSLKGGRQLYDWGVNRPNPIPVFAEMGSTNPIFILPGALEKKSNEWASAVAGSVQLGVGQFCTNPGMIIGIDTPALDEFKAALAQQISQSQMGNMLHEGILTNYRKGITERIAKPAVKELARGAAAIANGAEAILASVSATDYNADPELAEEIFGPTSLVIDCQNETELLQLANGLSGQLTATILAEPEDAVLASKLLEILPYHCGRIIVNNVPTGVEVCDAMQHGGPYPATTDSRFTSVGLDAAARFLRPVAYQQVPTDWLPQELRQ